MLNYKSTILLATLIISDLTGLLDLTGFKNLSGLANAALNDTGITTCSNATQNGLPCPVAGFPGQDAEYGTNSFDFTKLDANGNAMAVTATNHSCVKDNVTGLIWEVKTDDGGLRDKDNRYTFDGTATFAANVNATNLCGHNDWRVPNPHELASIVDYSISSPGTTIDEDYFPYTSNTYHWTNASYAANSSGSWIVNFYDGHVDDSPRDSDYAVRLVRSGQWILPLVFTDQGNGTITEQNTGLMWAKCSVGQGVTDCSGSANSLTWQQALQAADSSTLAGYTDWRLPNVKELHTVVDYTKYYPSINPSVFPNTQSSLYWSNSPFNYAADSSYSWFVHFYEGYIGSTNRGSTHVRLVRNVSTPVITKPTAITTNPTVITASSTRLGGTVTPNGAATTVSFDFGFTTAYGLNFPATPATIAATAATTAVIANKAGLNCNSVYHYRVKAVNSAGTRYGADKTFTTGACLVSVTVNPPYPVASTYNAGQTATLYWTTTGAQPADNMVLSMKRDAAYTHLEPNGRDWYRFTGTGFVPNNAGVAGKQVTIPGGLTVASDWRFYVRHYTGGAYDATDAKFNYLTGIPDFVITNIFINPATPVAGGTFSATITVKNQGLGTGNGGYLDLWPSQFSTPNCGATSTYRQSVGSLAVGASKNIIFTALNALPAGTAGSKILGAFVDSACSTAETNETNNQRSLSYRVSTRKPDFVVTAITVTPTTPAANSNVTLAVTIKNQGTLLGSGFLDVWANQVMTPACGNIGNQWKDIGSLAAGASATFNFTLPVGAAGAKTAYAFVDSWCETVESNEANNQLSKNYTVQ